MLYCLKDSPLLSLFYCYKGLNILFYCLPGRNITPKFYFENTNTEFVYGTQHHKANEALKLATSLSAELQWISVLILATTLLLLQWKRGHGQWALTSISVYTKGKKHSECWKKLHTYKIPGFKTRKWGFSLHVKNSATDFLFLFSMIKM